MNTISGAEPDAISTFNLSTSSARGNVTNSTSMLFGSPKFFWMYCVIKLFVIGGSPLGVLFLSNNSTVSLIRSPLASLDVSAELPLLLPSLLASLLASFPPPPPPQPANANVILKTAASRTSRDERYRFCIMFCLPFQFFIYSDLQCIRR
ncbi:hypothetical protein D3C77_604160 [compost metagenome]